MLNTANEIKSTDLLHLLQVLIRFDRVGKPPYSMGLMIGLEQARRLGLKEMTVVEFGVFKGAGLRELANAAVLLAEASHIRINVLGFDTGAGMPRPRDYRDHPESWDFGAMVMPPRDEILAMLPRHRLVECDLVLGDVTETVQSRLMPMLGDAAPLAFAAVDVDSYTSAAGALACLLGPATHYLPTVPVYMDDIEYNLAVCSKTGEGLAVAEFNAMSDRRFLERKAVRTQYPPKLWHPLMHFCQVFDHPARQPGAGVDLNINVLQF